MVSFKRLTLTTQKIDIPRLAKKSVIKAKFEESGVCRVQTWVAATWAWQACKRGQPSQHMQRRPPPGMRVRCSMIYGTSVQHTVEAS